jgi:hypothetical protein
VRTSARFRRFTSAKQRWPYYSGMWTKQHQALCGTCGRNTNHVTHYHKDDVGGALIAEVRCAEHKDVPVINEASAAAWRASAEPAA